MYLPFEDADLKFLTHATVTNAISIRTPHPIPTNMRIYSMLPDD